MFILAVKKTHEEFLKEVKDKFGEEYSILTEYKNARTKIKIMHNKCRRKYERRPDSVNNITCKFCSRIRYTEEEIKEKIKTITNNEYELIGNFTKINAKSKIRHNKCGYEWDCNLHHFINNGTRCPICIGKNIKKDTETFKKEVYKEVGDEYDVLGDYKTTHEKIKMKHNICNKIFEVRPSDFLSHKNRCPFCNNLSKGENEISKVLDKLNLKYIKEYKFEDCKNIIDLKFDFYIPNINLVIEYDGIQHFKPVKFFGGEKRFILDKKRDNIKNNYCKENNINLLRIPYYDFKNIEKIISSTTIEITNKI